MGNCGAVKLRKREIQHWTWVGHGANGKAQPGPFVPFASSFAKKASDHEGGTDDR